MQLKQLYKPRNDKMRLAAFMSGTGSNLRKILEKKGNFEVVMIFTDNEKSNAKKIADENKISYYCNDIREYYQSKGKDRKDMNVRKEYDKETAELLKKHNVDVVVLCGYMSVVTEEICDNYLTLNIHPADLRILDDKGARLYAGCMGAGCIKKVIENNGKELRSSTHIVTAEVDGGAVIMVSAPVKIDNNDERQLLEKLKEQGDWKVYPETVKRLAEGRFWIGEGTVIDLVEEKTLLREGMRKMRENMDDEEVKSKSEAATKRLLELQEYVTAKTVMFYMGINKEVQTNAAISNALASKKKVVIPVSDLDKKCIIPSQLESLDAMRLGAYGIPEPSAMKEVNANEIELIIVPGLAFDEKGNRIGYGLGFFDRFMEKIAGKKIALAYESQIVDMVRTTEHDVAVDKIITEERVIDCGVSR
ncbi:5-formyltetrahydrofolate cyclo-ligase [Candidatus Woesearchaeota archaeon]|nr:5-formyltetrahydrofolate cyclo-ligase [Candidatus Woesearchaeota archaeon]|tara:strand:+ start:18976 stop:20232 length:1257 start_codon:yes stop_codon:yes gene_type:complete